MFRKSIATGFVFGLSLGLGVILSMGAVRTISSFSDPSVSQEAITKSDTVGFPGGKARGIYVGGTGDVVVVDAAGNAVTWSSIPAGFIIPAECIRVNSTSTTATLMVALFGVLALPYWLWKKRS